LHDGSPQTEALPVLSESVFFLCFFRPLLDYA
jgi:hypothetical protein